MLRFLLAGFFRLRQGILQGLKLLHFTLRLCRFPLLTIEASQSEMSLCRQRTLFLNRKEFRPGFLCSGGIAFQ